MLKVVAYMKGRARSLNEHYPITAHVPNLDFLADKMFMRIQKIHIVLYIEPLKIFA